MSNNKNPNEIKNQSSQSSVADPARVAVSFVWFILSIVLVIYGEFSAVVVVLSGLFLSAIFGVIYNKSRVEFFGLCAIAPWHILGILLILPLGILHLLLVFIQSFNGLLLKLASKFCMMDGVVIRWMYRVELQFVFPQMYTAMVKRENQPKKPNQSKEKNTAILPPKNAVVQSYDRGVKINAVAVLEATGYRSAVTGMYTQSLPQGIQFIGANRVAIPPNQTPSMQNLAQPTFPSWPSYGTSNAFTGQPTAPFDRQYSPNPYATPTFHGFNDWQSGSSGFPPYHHQSGEPGNPYA
jgi:hypothetical protein